MSRQRKKRPQRVRETSPAYSVDPERKLLLDTNAWIWWYTNDRRLGPRSRLAIQSAQQVYFSVVSAWEITIKTQRGKLELAPGVDLSVEIAADGFVPMPIDLDHVLGIALLPSIHRDPFDRLLVSQAIVEALTIVSADDAIVRYPVSVLDARV